MKELPDQLKNIVNMKDREVETVEDLEKIAQRTQSINYFKDAKKESLLDRMLPECYTRFNYDCKIDQLNEETLFYIFYCVTDGNIQIDAYNELIKRGYAYTKLYNMFVYTKEPFISDNKDRIVETFNIDEWCKESIKITFDDNFIKSIEKSIIIK